MNALTSVLWAQDPGTTINIQNSNITNTNSNDPAWNGIEAVDGAEIDISDSTLSGNAGASYLFSSRAGSTLTIERVDIIDNTGGDMTGDSVVHGNAGTIVFRDSLVQATNDFTVSNISGVTRNQLR